MYEHVNHGLGWSELSWGQEIATLGVNCEFETWWEKPRSVCFENTPEDQAIANMAQCVRQRNFPCETQGRDGAVWCCEENMPRDYMQNIPSDVSSHEEERRRLLALEPEALAPDDQPDDEQPDDPNRRGPRPVHRHTFWTRLTHPGAITAMVTIAGGGALFYYLKRQRERR